MTIRVLILISSFMFGFSATVLFLSFAHAADLVEARHTERLPNGVTCQQVRYLVSNYGYKFAVSQARQHGWTQHQINAARRCLTQKAEDE
jgi:hypothetical protein